MAHSKKCAIAMIINRG